MVYRKHQWLYQCSSCCNRLYTFKLAASENHVHFMSHRLVSHQSGVGSLQLLLLNNNTTWKRRTSQCYISTYATTYPKLSSSQTVDVPYRDDRRKLFSDFGHLHPEGHRDLALCNDFEQVLSVIVNNSTYPNILQKSTSEEMNIEKVVFCCSSLLLLSSLWVLVVLRNRSYEV